MLSKERKEAIIAEYGKTATDTGSPEVQVALLTARINELNALKSKSEGSSFQKRSFKDGWSETWFTCLLKESRYREISCFNRAFRFEKVISCKRKPYRIERSCPLYFSVARLPQVAGYP